MPNQQSTPSTIPVEVTVTYDQTSAKFNATYNLDPVTVSNPNTTIAYTIVSSNPDGITFTGMAVRGPDTAQLGTPTISNNGATISVADRNTVAEMLNITLQFKTAEGLPFTHDPQIENDPR